MAAGQGSGTPAIAAALRRRRETTAASRTNVGSVPLQVVLRPSVEETRLIEARTASLAEQERRANLENYASTLQSLTNSQRALQDFGDTAGVADDLGATIRDLVDQIRASIPRRQPPSQQPSQ